jgi:uncharacterized protein GlcG (DUF336 family)
MEDLQLDLQSTQDLIAHMVGQARERFHKPVSVAVCDAYGLLAGFIRGDGAPLRTIPLAQQKAYTASRMGSTTAAFLARLRREEVPIGFFCDPLMTALPGGAPLLDGRGRMVGAIGISGLAPDDDQALADAGASFFSHNAKIS